jgi:uncharacterized protein YjdB
MGTGAEGTARFLATSTAEGSTFTVSASFVKNVTAIRTPQSTVQMTPGASITMPFVPDSDNARTGAAEADARITYKSSDTSVLSVDASTGQATARKIGSAYVTASTLNGMERQVFVKIVSAKSVTQLKWKSSKKGVLSIGSATAKISAKKKGRATVSATSLSGDRIKVAFKVAKKTGSMKGVKWTSSNKRVMAIGKTSARVSVRKKGAITLIGRKKVRGKTKVVAKIDAKVTVKTKALPALSAGGIPSSMSKGSTSQIAIAYDYAKATNSAPSFRSSDQNVLTVDKAGRITAKSPGKATITVSCGGAKTARSVTVS